MPITGIYGPDDFGNPIHRQATGAARPRVTDAERARALPMPSLEWTPEVERATAHLYAKVKNVIPEIEWPFMAPYVKAINDLKTQRNAVILAHNYQTPEIFHCVADIGGDSLQLAREAAKVKEKVIVQCGVHFMAESADILSGDDQIVCLPNLRAGCAMADLADDTDVEAALAEVASMTTEKSEEIKSETAQDDSLKPQVGRDEDDDDQIKFKR